MITYWAFALLITKTPITTSRIPAAGMNVIIIISHIRTNCSLLRPVCVVVVVVVVVV